MPEEHRPYTASYLILEKQDEVLLLQRQNTGYRDGKYSLVAGHVDEGENFRQAMIREAEEEVGIVLEKEDLETVTVMHRESDGRTYIDIFFRATEWEGTVENREPEKCSDISWYPKNDLPDNTLNYVEKVVDTLDRGMTYEERGWN